MSNMGDLMLQLMERYNVEDIDEVLNIIEKEHDCHLIAGEDGCDHPSHEI